MEDLDQGPTKRSIREAVKATDEQIGRAPRGDITHRVWGGHCLKKLRKQHADEQDIRTATACNVQGQIAWERALLTRPPMPRRRPASEDPFYWHFCPSELPVEGHVYPDGSLLDGIAPELGRTGWACVVLNDEAHAVFVLGTI